MTLSGPPEALGGAGYGTPNPPNVQKGSGGGSAAAHSQGTPPSIGGPGGAGGAAISLVANTITVNGGTILADGGQGQSPTPGSFGAIASGGGGGSGGGIWLDGALTFLGASLSANGGQGGSTTFVLATGGGGGGGGRIKFSGCMAVASFAVSTTGGVPGFSTSTGNLPTKFPSPGVGGTFVDATTGPCLSIEKERLEGPDQVGIALPTATTYVFEINYTGPAAQVQDAVPAEFEVTNLSAIGGTATSFSNKNKSATHITWDVPAGSHTLTVTIETRESPGKRNNKKGEPPVFKPTSCGPLPINDGATAFEVDENGVLVLVEVVDPDTGDVTLEPVVIVGPSNSLGVEAVAGAKPCEGL